MTEQEDCYSTDGIERTENKQRARCTEAKYRLVFTDHHKRLRATHTISQY